MCVHIVNNVLGDNVFLTKSDSHRRTIVTVISAAIFALCIQASCSSSSDQSRTSSTPTTPAPNSSFQTFVSPENRVTITSTEQFALDMCSHSHGEMFIESNLPVSQVDINGELKGQTPYHVKLPQGDYTVTVRVPGFHAWEETVKLEHCDAVHLKPEFNFNPMVEKILDVCVDHFWWAENGKSFYYQECTDPDTGGFELARGEGPFHAVSLETGELTETYDAWPPYWIPRSYTSMVPESVPGYLVSVSPSGQKVVFLEEFPMTPQPTPSEVGMVSSAVPEYILHAIDPLGDHILGKINSVPGTISWASDENLVFISSSPFFTSREKGWLIDLKNRTATALTPPPVNSLPTSSFFNASLLPSGDRILFQPELTVPSILWEIKDNQVEELEFMIGWREWLANNNYMVFLTTSPDSMLLWYDLETATAIPILEGASIPLVDERSISPDGTRLLYKKFSTTGRDINGLWLLTFDSR